LLRSLGNIIYSKKYPGSIEIYGVQNFGINLIKCFGFLLNYLFEDNVREMIALMFLLQIFVFFLSKKIDL